MWTACEPYNITTEPTHKDRYPKAGSCMRRPGFLLTWVVSRFKLCRMLAKTKCGIVLFLLLAVVVLTILPSFDLDPTLLRAARRVAALFNAMAVAASLPAVMQIPFHLILSAFHVPRDNGPRVLDLTCARLC